MWETLAGINLTFGGWLNYSIHKNGDDFWMAYGKIVNIITLVDYSKVIGDQYSHGLFFLEEVDDCRVIRSFQKFHPYWTQVFW